MALTNLEILVFVRGWKGGDIHDLAYELGVSISDIIYADDARMNKLCIIAQNIRWKQQAELDINNILLKHLGICLSKLNVEYEGHAIPPWLERANGVYTIISEN